MKVVGTPHHAELQGPGRDAVSLLLASLGFGLVTAAVLAIAAVGFTMQFAVTDVLNLAYGAVMIVPPTSPTPSTRPA